MLKNHFDLDMTVVLITSFLKLEKYKQIGKNGIICEYDL